MKNQKTATYDAITNVIGTTRTTEDTTPLKLSKDDKAKVKAILVEGFKNEEIELKNEQDNLDKYANGLISNWIRKDKRFNGNVDYKAQNPGSRAGQGDAQVKNLRLLLKTDHIDDAARVEIEAAIKTRLAEIKPNNAPTIVVDALPEEFRHLVPTV